MPNFRVILTGFEPAYGIRKTPSGDLMGVYMRGEISIPGVEVHPLILPQVFGTSSQIVISEMDKIQPHAVVMFGATMKVEPVRVEKFAVNVENTHMGDNNRIPVYDRRINPNGPSAYEATWDVQDLHDALNKRGSSGKISYHAGTHTCNSLMYNVVHHISTNPAHANVKAGFIHVPFPGNYGVEENHSKISTLNDVVKASKIIIERLMEVSRAY